MTFFDKKTEVMTTELTPYGRYLYSIGKFMPHSYEFIDDDILYRSSGSTEEIHESHRRIVDNTPKLKPNRSKQISLGSANRNESITIEDVRKPDYKMDLRQNGQFALGRSSYSSGDLPYFEATMIKGELSSSKTTYEMPSSQSGTVFIPQVEIDFELLVETRNQIVDPIFNSDMASKIHADGNYLKLSYEEPIILLKEFNSFYEKQNFEIEVFEVNGENLIPKKQQRKPTAIVGDMLLTDEGLRPVSYEVEELIGNENLVGPEFTEYFFDIEVDDEIPSEIICEQVEKLEINNHFIDEELNCPDKRTERFDIYATNVTPDDLEDC